MSKLSKFAYFRNSTEYFCDYDGCLFSYPENNLFTTDNKNDLNEAGEKNRYCKMHSFKCNNCKKIFGNKNLRKNYTLNVNYCDFCYYKLNKCKACGQRASNEYLVLIDGDYSLCEQCAKKCSDCEEYTDKESGSPHVLNKHGNEGFVCEDCLSRNYFNCNNCNNWMHKNFFGRSYENINKETFNLCRECGKVRCNKCSKIIPARMVDEYSTYFYGEQYCNDCYSHLRDVPKEFEKAQTITIFNKEYYLNELKKLLPISVRELKQKHPNIAKILNDLIIFGKGHLSKDIIDAYEKLHIESQKKFNIEYSGWGSRLQRMRADKDKNIDRQLVLNITVDTNNLNEETKQTIYFMNKVYENKGHPSKDNQIGWIRVELNSEKKYLLIEEIQSDLAASLYKAKHNNLDDHQEFFTSEVIHELEQLLKNFPQLAVNAVLKFAKSYGYKTLFWHSLHNKTDLQGAEPPEYFYTKLPKEFDFKETDIKPFDLPGNYLMRQAKRKEFLKKLASKINFDLF